MIPLVSVIIPTYNRWPMVGEAVESVLAQNLDDFEVIVVDDGSTDDTASRLERYAGVTVLRQSRHGVSAARNFGARHARGRYVAFLDSDDLWLPGKLRIQTSFLERHAESLICQTEEIWIRRGVRVNPKLRHRKLSGDIFRQSLELCLVSPSAVMMTREFFQRVGGFDEAFAVCEDYDLWLRISAGHPIALIDTPLVIKRGGHPDQLSRSVWGMDRFRVAALQKLLRSGLSGERRDWALDALRRKANILAQGARKRGQWNAAAEFEEMALEFVEDRAYVGGADSGARQVERVSSTHG